MVTLLPMKIPNGTIIRCAGGSEPVARVAILNKTEGIMHARALIDPLGSDELMELARRTFRGSLFHTAKYLLGMSDITESTHGDMVNALEELEFRHKGIASALVIMPRGAL